MLPFRSLVPTGSIKCPHCGKEMKLDDIDFNFKGNQNEYWTCPHCHFSAIAKIRYGRYISTSFFPAD